MERFRPFTPAHLLDTAAQLHAISIETGCHLDAAYRRAAEQTEVPIMWLENRCVEILCSGQEIIEE